MLKMWSMQDGPLLNLRKAGVPLSLCVHLRDKTKALRPGLDCRQSKFGLSYTFLFEPVQDWN